jgi:hypothetical protein
MSSNPFRELLRWTDEDIEAYEETQANRVEDLTTEELEDVPFTGTVMDYEDWDDVLEPTKARR